ncbi:MAG: tRNA (adenosine(37)-N6)-threonylcarbamoyltransferase complex dimerization subunit type 1 TsaB [Verrucomicrobiia bacterium]
MLILALEFSSSQRSVALAEHSGSGTTILGTAWDKGARGIGPLPLIERLLSKVAVPRESVSCVAVGLGPGSYTGIRSALSLAQGWRLARGVRLAGVSCVECLALQAREQGWFGRIRIVVDAQRNELYVADYELSADAHRLVEPLRLVKVEEVGAGDAVSEQALIGPEVTRWFSGGRTLFPEAQALARLAVAQTDSGQSELEPIYLRQTTFVKAPPSRPIPM